MDRQNLIKMAMLGLAVIALVYLVTSYRKGSSVNSGSLLSENFDNCDNHEEKEGYENMNEREQDQPAENFESGQSNESEGVSASEPMGQNAVYQSLDASASENQHPKDCFPKDQLTPGELLPGDANSRWAQSVPAGQGELGDQNFLTAGHHIGVNTVGQTLRNANRQLRSEPPNPQVKVSPWLQSTIEADTNRKPLEIGGCQ